MRLAISVVGHSGVGCDSHCYDRLVGHSGVGCDCSHNFCLFFAILHGSSVWWIFSLLSPLLTRGKCRSVGGQEIRRLVIARLSLVIARFSPLVMV